MSRCLLLAVGACAVAACSGKSAEPVTTPPPPADAAIDGITQIGSNDPGRFIDPDPADPTRRVGQQTRKPHNRPSRPIDVNLKSTPDRAVAAVDGVEVGRTPTYWFGESDGLEHTFTFTRPNYATAIYRFVPIQSGTLHVKLEPVSSAQLLDAGVADPVTTPNGPPAFTPADPGPPGPVETPKAPGSDTPLKPPDTVVSPIDAAPAPGSGSGSAKSGSGSGGSKIGPAP